MKKLLLLLAFLFSFSSAFLSCRDTVESEEEVEDVEINQDDTEFNEVEGEGLDEVEAEFEEAGEEVSGELEEASDEAIDRTSEELDESLNIDNETEDAGL